MSPDRTARRLGGGSDGGMEVLAAPGADEGVVVVTHPGALLVRSYEALAEELGGIGLGVLQIDKIPEYRRSMLGGEPLEITVAEIAERFVAEIHEFAGDRPVVLLGWSFGGVLAYGTAERLAADRVVEHLFLLDSIAPGEGDPGKKFGDSLPSREGLDWFAMYFGAKRGAPLGFAYSDFENMTTTEGLSAILERCKQRGIMERDTSVAGLRKVFEAFVDGILRNKQLHDGFDPGPPAFPVTLVRPQRGLFDDVSSLGWEPVVGDVAVHYCPGDHYTMFSNPEAAKSIAALVDSALRH
ncbi:thioesterase domain-containing protein [Saccharopolyspora sp. NPDC050389]|uniref:thioesterase domain-containing protein n=1 Tax=Saccharopolyspora sp. NPDC050389 TaxID=3155516 RepID=UPI0033C7A65B